MNALLRQGKVGPKSSLVSHEARLLQHFENDTVTSMGYGTTPQQAWCVAIPDLTRKHSFVLHGVLAVTALHLSTHLKCAAARNKYRNMAAEQLNTGLVQYKTAIGSVTSDNTEALFTFSTAISLFASFQATTECRILLESIWNGGSSAAMVQMSISKTVQTICRHLRTLRGAKIILVPGWAKLRNGPLRPIVQRESWSATMPITEVHRHEESRLKSLESMWSNKHRAYEDYFDTLRQAWQSLCESFVLVWNLVDNAPSEISTKGPDFDWTSIFHWPVQSSSTYICLLEQRCIEAWVLLAHFAMLQAEVRGLWWLNGSATNIVTTAALVIGANNWEWIAWPAANIGIDLERLRPFAMPNSKICS